MTSDGNSRQRVVLVADDDLPIRHLVTLLMQQEGHLVLSAADGHEGLEVARQYPQPIDLVITDLEMPKLDGTQLCACLMEEQPGIKVLIISGSDVADGFADHSGKLPFLPKPFDGQTLKQRVRALLGISCESHLSRLRHIDTNRSNGCFRSMDLRLLYVLVCAAKQRQSQTQGEQQSHRREPVACESLAKRSPGNTATPRRCARNCSAPSR